jgi:hypothetical protein
VQGMSTFRGTAFSTPSVICELYLLHSKHYWPTGILIHRQNLYAPHSRRCTSCCEAQLHEPVNRGKNHPILEAVISGTSRTKGLPVIRMFFLIWILAYLVTSCTDITI